MLYYTTIYDVEVLDTGISVRAYKATSYAFGLSAMLTALGLTASYVGALYGSINLSQVSSAFTGEYCILLW